jgi:hypothetical protein
MKQILAQYAAENAKLRQDLERLWADNHLTSNHQIVITSCPNGDHMAYAASKNGEQWQANDKLIESLQGIYDSYEFEQLEFWPCCNNCGAILFARTIDGMIEDMINDEVGNLSAVPSTGVVGDDDDIEDWLPQQNDSVN